MQMSLSYSDKRAIAEYLAELGRWRNTFVDDGFDSLPSPRDLDPPEDKKDPNDGWRHCFHSISFAGDEWNHIPVNAFMNGLRLTVAHDFGLQPKLESFNRLDDHRGAAFVSQMHKRKKPFGFLQDCLEKPLRVTEAEASWNDAVDFDSMGWVDVGTHARFQKTEDGFDLCTDSDRRDQLLSLGLIMKRAAEDRQLTCEDYDANAFPLGEIFDRLENVPEIETYRGERWRTMRIVSQKAPSIARELRDKEGLSQLFCAAINDDAHSVLVTANLDRVQRLYTSPLHRAAAGGLDLGEFEEELEALVLNFDTPS
ncbi:hypothetical protein N9Z27_02950 [Alphaproteobacteria bacterium]|nr:hypothetical protein [Alphaproteobacteria bacterium]